MHVGQIGNSQSLNVSSDVQKSADHVQSSEQSRALVKHQSTDFLFELGSVKVQLHKENRTEYKRSNLDSDTESFRNSKKMTMSETSDGTMNVAEVSVAKQKMNALFKPTPMKSCINLLA